MTIQKYFRLLYTLNDLTKVKKHEIFNIREKLQKQSVHYDITYVSFASKVVCKLAISYIREYRMYFTFSGYMTELNSAHKLKNEKGIRRKV